MVRPGEWGNVRGGGTIVRVSGETDRTRLEGRQAVKQQGRYKHNALFIIVITTERLQIGPWVLQKFILILLSDTNKINTPEIIPNIPLKCKVYAVIGMTHSDGPVFVNFKPALLTTVVLPVVQTETDLPWRGGWRPAGIGRGTPRVCRGSTTGPFPPGAPAEAARQTGTPESSPPGSSSRGAGR